MKQIIKIEKHLSPKHKMLLYALRENNWEICQIENVSSHWAFDQKWIIKSTKEHRGLKIQLWFFRHIGLYDGMNTVTATTMDNKRVPDLYFGNEGLFIDFDGRKFELQLNNFIEKIQKVRLSKIIA